MRRAGLMLLAAMTLGPGLAWGQADPATLADIRGQIASLSGEIGGLRAELSATGAGVGALGGTTALERLDAVEAALQSLTAATEELEFRVNRVVTDGTNRLGDLEFRICELEEGCDVGSLGDAPALGGVDGAADIPVPAEPVEPPPTTGAEGGGPDLAVSEQADFERAEGALAQGDFRGAADLFAAFVAAYPGGPLNARAHFGRGEALTELGDASEAARAYLDSFSADTDGDVAPDALVGLGRSLGALGQVPDACVTLGEVATRFPASPLVLEAQAERRALACP